MINAVKADKVMEMEEFRGKVKDLINESVRDIEKCPSEKAEPVEKSSSSSGNVLEDDSIIGYWVERGAALGDKIFGIPGVLIFGFIAGGIGCFKSIAQDLKG